ncbi:MAG: hypothetical protein LPJ92_13705, partial [Rhodobacterales bacterium]|nr:hypothetical protein [Rhodobacterales bacterium]MDX5391389.1 hypothetical protein [Rhodobacterales bacterium]MDX5491089.1 hypothetical protein [Rhodobacterales bacterium]
LRLVAGRLKRTPSDLFIEDIDIQTISAFREHIEEGRANSVRSRNARLAAIKSFFRLVEHRHSACLEQAIMIRAMPAKRRDAKLIDYLSKKYAPCLPRRTATRRAQYGTAPCSLWPMPKA